MSQFTTPVIKQFNLLHIQQWDIKSTTTNFKSNFKIIFFFLNLYTLQNKGVQVVIYNKNYTFSKRWSSREAECHWLGGCSNCTPVSAPENIWKKGELKELSESTVHRKIMFPDIVQIQCVKQLYRDLISINIYFAFFSFLFKYNV